MATGTIALDVKSTSAKPGLFGHFTSDAVSSLVVFLVALPLCMGVAIASGAPPALGIVTGIVGGIVVGAIGGAPLQVSGPAAGLSVIVFEIVQKLGLEMLGPVLLLAGLLQLAGGWLKLGRWFRAISPAVIYGMLSGIGVLIIAGQFHVMVDSKPRPSGMANLLAIPESLSKAIMPEEGTVHHLAAAIAALTLVSIFLWNRYKPQKLQVVPGSLIGVVLGTGAAALFHLPIRYVTLPANLFSGFKLPDATSVQHLTDPAFLIASVTIAIVASAETLLSAAAVDRMHNGPRTNFDRELSAQGIGNFICGLFGALPMTGVIVRSSANVKAGAKSRLSTILHGIWLLALVMLFPSVLRIIPTASLAAILVFTGFNLIEIHHIKALRRYGRFTLFIYGATLAGILIEDLLSGVLIGVGLTLIKAVSKVTALNVQVTPSADERHIDVQLGGIATFLRLPKLAAAIDKLPADRPVYFHVDGLHYIDHTCFELLKAIAEQKAQTGSTFVVPWEKLEHRFNLKQDPVPSC